MKTQRSPVSRKRRGLSNCQHGFALTVSLLMMVLLTIIVLGLLSLSAVTLRTSSQSEPRAIAEANARMALMIAIGQLQAEMGPDQRVNATADLLTPELSEGRQRWVGTWDSWPANQTTRPEPKFRNWLISGTRDKQGDIYYSNSATDLVPLTYSQDKTSILMSAPRVGLENGGYAYAVADENAKARLGPTVNPNDESLTAHLSRYQSPPAGHGALPGLNQILRDDPRMNQLVSQRTVDLISTQEPQSLIRPDSYTVWSKGLLTNVRKGGFRQDLSLYFSDPATGANSVALYSGTRLNNTARNGINFRELRTFHEVCTKLTYDAASFTHPDGGPLNPKVPVMAGFGDMHTAAKDPFFAYMRPMIIRISWLISAYSVRVPNTNPAQYQLYPVVEPIVWLWNPFDVNLVMRSGGHLSVKFWGLPYNITTKAGAQTNTRAFNNFRAGSWTRMEIGMNVARPCVMRPGEVLIFSRGQQAATPSTSTAGFEGRLGWSGTGGFRPSSASMTVDGSTPITISMNATTNAGSNSGQLMSFLHFVGTEGNIDYQCGWHNISGSGNSIRAQNFPPGMFNDVPEKTFLSAANLTTPQPLALFSYFARTEREGKYKWRYLNQMSPVGMGFSHDVVDPASLQSVTFEPVMETLSGGLASMPSFNAGKGFFGASYDVASGQSYLVTHSIPRQRPISLGAFQHALANGMEYWKFNAGGQTFQQAPYTNWYDRILQPSTNHAIGNSLAHPCIAPNQTSGNFNNARGWDHSWLANQALWDDWFLSSLSTQDSGFSSSPANARTLFDGLTAKTPQPLQNRHYRYAGGDPEADTATLFTGAIPNSNAYQKVASMLSVDGAFNVNSTDRDAWLAMFRSSQDLKVPVESSPAAVSTWETANNPIAALLIPKGSAATTNDLADPSTEAQWRGYRDPSEPELEEFATAMVEEVRTRGPFLSLGDFVNRRLSTDVNLASCGAMQAALDRSLNKILEAGARSGGVIPMVAFPEADQGSLMTHVPGHVKQGDILTALGTRFTPRSDTFSIRAYGEALDSNSKVLASARCEAVVQRDAEYIDPTDDTSDLPTDLNSEANKRFGRKFSVVSFRWISKNEP